MTLDFDWLLVRLSAYAARIGWLRFVLQGAGAGMLTVASFITTDGGSWVYVLLGVGLCAMVAAIALDFGQGDLFDVSKRLVEAHTKLETAHNALGTAEAAIRFYTSWNVLEDQIRELQDAILVEDSLAAKQKKAVLRSVIDLIVERKFVLLGLEDDFWNVAIYEYDEASEELICQAFRRSSPVDTGHEPRRWRSGEGHVGIAYQRRDETVCDDAGDPRMQQLVDAPPAKSRAYDRERYVSLAAFPIGLDQDAPTGVLVLTSDVAGRFAVAKDVGDDGSPRTLGAMRGVARLLAQLLYLINERLAEEVHPSVKGKA